MSKYLSVFVCLGFLACQKPESHPAPAAPVESTYFVSGDPMTIIEGTKLNNKSFLTESNIDSIDSYDVRIISFVRKNLRAGPKDLNAAMESQKPAAENVTKEALPTFSLKMSKDARGIKNYTYSNPILFKGTTFYITPSLSDPKVYEFTGIKTGDGEVEKIEVLHYSLKNDKSAFSILLSDTFEDQKYLLDFVFTKKVSGLPVKIADQKFNYLYGPGVRIGWDQKEELNLKLCGQEALRFGDALRRAVDQWSPTLEGRLKYSTETQSICPPFSDLNVKGVYFIKNYIMVASQVVVNMMTTIYSSNFDTSQLVDSDIFVFQSEYQKYLDQIPTTWDDPRIDKVADKFFGRSMTHEFGHMLGLDHQFDGTESIMSYDDNTKNITQYDQNAVEALYPEKKNIFLSRLGL